MGTGQVDHRAEGGGGAGVEDVIAALDGHLGRHEDVVGSRSRTRRPGGAGSRPCRGRRRPGRRDLACVLGPVVDRVAHHLGVGARQDDEQDLLAPGRELVAQFVHHAAAPSADRLAQGGHHLPQRVMPVRPLTARNEDRVPVAAGLHRPDRHRGLLQRLPVLVVLHEHGGRL